MSGPAPDKTVGSLSIIIYVDLPDYFLTAPILLMNLDWFQFLVFVAYATRTSLPVIVPRIWPLFIAVHYEKVFWDSFKVEVIAITLRSQRKSNEISNAKKQMIQT